MKNLKDYILERGSVPQNQKKDDVYVIKDTDLDGAIIDVCDTKDDADETLDRHLKENPDSHMTIEKTNRSEVENI